MNYSNVLPFRRPSTVLSVLFAFLFFNTAADRRIDDEPPRRVSVASTKPAVSSPYLYALANLHSQRSVKQLQAGTRTQDPTQQRSADAKVGAKVKSTRTSALSAADASMQLSPAAAVALASGSTRRAPPSAADEGGGRLMRLRRRKFETKMSGVQDESGATMVPLTELDIKSDAELQKLFYRTTAKMMEHSRSIKTTPVPPVTTANLPTALTTAPSLFGALFGQPKAVTLPSLITVPPSTSQLPTTDTTRPPALRSNTSTEQFEQLGCSWDLLTQSCKDVFQLGWCQQCVDFGNVFLHDCKCAAVTPFYASTLAAFASAAAAANHSTALGGASPQPHAQLPLADLFATQQQQQALQQLSTLLSQQKAQSVAGQPIPGQPQSTASAFPAAADFSQALAGAQRQAFLNAIQQQQQFEAAQRIFAAQQQQQQAQPGRLAPAFHNLLQPFPASALTSAVPSTAAL